MSSFGVLLLALTAEGARQAAPSTSAFARSNLHVWAFEEYDAVQRTPDQRAQVLRALGIKKAGYVGRNIERMKEFDSYLAAYRERGIELVSVWTPIHTEDPLREPHIRMFLHAVERHEIRPQWWLTLERFDQGVERAVTILRPLIAEAARHGLHVALYGHGRDAWFTQPESQIAIIESLGSVGPLPVGMVYNFHHAHSQLDRFADLFPKMQPHLMAVNLNGMSTAGPQIVPIGEGDRERDMIATIYRSGYAGPIGIIGHQREEDVAVVLRRNMDGLREILTAIGDRSGAATY